MNHKGYAKGKKKCHIYFAIYFSGISCNFTIKYIVSKICKITILNGKCYILGVSQLYLLNISKYTIIVFHSIIV